MAEEIPDMQGNNRESGYKSPPVETQFKKGQSGNPKGRPKSALYSDALRRKLSDVDPADEKQRTGAEILAEQAYLKAKGGDLHALGHIADRVEGKARQTITLTTERRDQLERMVTHYIETEAAEGRPTNREAAIKTLSIFEPDVSELLN